MIKGLSAGACALMVAATMASASVKLEFEGWHPVDEATETFADKGFTYQDSLTYFAVGNLYLHDDGGLTTSTIRREDGRAFTVHMGDIWASSRAFQAVEGPNPTGDTRLDFRRDTPDGPQMHLVPVPIGYAIEGFVGMRKVAGIYGLSPVFQTFDFGDVFRGIDRLVVTLDLPEQKPGAWYRYWPLFVPTSDVAPYEPGETVCDEWCANLHIDNLVVSTVPLPAGFGLLATGLGLLAVARTRKRRT